MNKQVHTTKLLGLKKPLYSDLPGDFEALKKAVFLKRPVLGEVLEQHGNKMLAEYAKSYKENPRTPDAGRQEEFIREVKELARAYLGAPVAESVERQLRRHYYISTTDHLGPLTHAFFVHANILAGLEDKQVPAPDHENTIVLACSNVSLNNSSLPRSLLFSNFTAGGESGERLNFFPSSDRLAPVYGFRAFTKNDVDRMSQSVEKGRASGKYSKAVADKLLAILREIYEQPDVLASRYFSEQITRSNHRLWKKIFTDNDSKQPSLVYLEQEKIVLNLLRNHHLFEETPLHDFIFDSKISARVEKLFDGIPGAFSLSEKKGTFLFWYFPKNSTKRLALRREGGELVSLDGKHRFPLRPDAVDDLIGSGQLIPSTMLCLVTLACYYGVKCLGGFSQVDYLTRMDKAYREIFNITLEEEDAFTKTLCGDFIIDTLPSSSELRPATGLDFILYGTDGSYARFKQNAERIRLDEALYLMLPELYRILYAENERSKNVLGITKADIAALFGITEKITPCLDTKLSEV